MYLPPTYLPINYLPKRADKRHTTQHNITSLPPKSHHIPYDPVSLIGKFFSASLLHGNLANGTQHLSHVTIVLNRSSENILHVSWVVLNFSLQNWYSLTYIEIPNVNPGLENEYGCCEKFVDRCMCGTVVEYDY